MKISSPAFDNNQLIPTFYTCEGSNTNPPLEFSDVPPLAKSLVIIMDDPDVPAQVRLEKMYDHWVLFNIPPNTTKIDANAKAIGVEGRNTSGKLGYTGPCPPREYLPTEHRYHVKLYALDISLSLSSEATKLQVEQAMKNHILAKTELIGRYEKTKLA